MNIAERSGSVWACCKLLMLLKSLFDPENRSDVGGCYKKNLKNLHRGSFKRNYFWVSFNKDVICIRPFDSCSIQISGLRFTKSRRHTSVVGSGQWYCWMVCWFVNLILQQDFKRMLSDFISKLLWMKMN